MYKEQQTVINDTKSIFSVITLCFKKKKVVLGIKLVQF